MNQILHCLSNRSGPFQAIPTLPEWSQPSVRPAQEQALRTKLCLDISTTDYYLTRYLANLYSWPDIWQGLLAGWQETFDPTLIARPKVVATSCELLADESGVSSFEEFNLVQNFPVPLRWALTYRDAATALFQDLDLGRQEMVAVVPSSEILRVAWPAWSPFSGPLKILQPWGPGERLEFVVEPAGFPWAAAVSKIQGDPWVNQQLAVLRLVDEYHGTTNPRLKLALVTAALVDAHPSYRR